MYSQLNSFSAAKNEIDTVRSDRGRKLRLLSLAVSGILLAGVLSVSYFRPRTDNAQAASFAVPPQGTEIGASTRVFATGQLMTLDPTGKFLINSSVNRPVFITGEAAWSLQGQLSDADIDLYLADRAAKGFNLIIVDLAENYYSNNPPKDFYGNVPFNGEDFTNPNEAYWARVDKTMNRAATYGITIMADPAFVGFNCIGGYCQSYEASSKTRLKGYGRFLGDRYKSFPNVIWLIGGDADPDDHNVQSKLAALASGIRSADNIHLITTENYRGSSSEDIWAGASWLDLDAVYVLPTGIRGKTSADYQAATYPVFLLEDWYEGEHSTSELGVREEGYWAVLSGSTLGRIFGNYAIWDFSWTGATSDPWKGQLNSVGSMGQAWLGKLFRSRAHWKLVPDLDHSVMTDGFGSGLTLSVAARTANGQTIIAYVPNGNGTAVTIDMTKITDSGSQARGWWFNPRDGSTTLLGSFSTTGTRDFTPPDGKDWVLVLDSQAANLPAPGTTEFASHTAQEIRSRPPASD